MKRARLLNVHLLRRLPYVVAVLSLTSCIRSSVLTNAIDDSKTALEACLSTRECKSDSCSCLKQVCADYGVCSASYKSATVQERYLGALLDNYKFDSEGLSHTTGTLRLRLKEDSPAVPGVVFPTGLSLCFKRQGERWILLGNCG